MKRAWLLAVLLLAACVHHQPDAPVPDDTGGAVDDVPQSQPQPYIAPDTYDDVETIEI